MSCHTAFDESAAEYDAWFDQHPEIYQSELLAILKAVPTGQAGIEIGVGSGRFAEPVGIKYGVEPSAAMAALAKKRGIKVFDAAAENLPIEDCTYDFATMVTTVCFVKDISKAFSEVYRIIKSGGAFIIGIIDRNSELGKKYEQQKETNKFYRDAHFYSAGEISSLLAGSGFGNFSYWQTLFNPDANKIEQPLAGYGKGSFVVIKAERK